MVAHKYLAHVQPDGTTLNERAMRSGYAKQRVPTALR
jgi:hypothetical protein